MMKLIFHAFVSSNLPVGLGFMIRDDKEKILMVTMMRMETTLTVEEAKSESYAFGLRRRWTLALIGL